MYNAGKDHVPMSSPRTLRNITETTGYTRIQTPGLSLRYAFEHGRECCFVENQDKAIQIIPHGNYQKPE
jgi:hypothetical protein